MHKLVIISKRVYSWIFRTKLSFLYKLKYLIEYFIVLILNKRSINYLGKEFKYDNKILPFSLMSYPLEIQESIIDYIDNEVKHVLDIGGNIGQFSLTLNYYLKDVFIDVFEPNKEILELLKINTSKYKNIRIYNKGVGKNKKAKLYFTEGKSAIGSLEKPNASNTQKDKIIETEIELVSDIKIITGSDKYDLIKIDVEGYEYEVLENIKISKPKYIFIEISTDTRYHSHTTSQLYELITKKFGRFEIVYSSPVNNKIAGYNQLLIFSF